jgi:hypothetical protein
MSACRGPGLDLSSLVDVQPLARSYRAAQFDLKEDALKFVLALSPGMDELPAEVKGHVVSAAAEPTQSQPSAQTDSQRDSGKKHKVKKEKKKKVRPLACMLRMSVRVLVLPRLGTFMTIDCVLLSPLPLSKDNRSEFCVLVTRFCDLLVYSGQGQAKREGEEAQER